MDKEIAIQINNLQKRFGEHQVLNNISITFESQSITGIIGRNGSGKTVLFKCICGFYRQDSGEIYLYGKENTESNNISSHIGAIIEEPAFLSGYSGIRNLELLYLIRNNKNKEHLREIMKMVGLEPDSKKKVGKYSMGMRQRLAIAQAIMENQEILILDEPMNGLDNYGVEEMRKLLIELSKQGKTILLASHNREDIEILCNQVYEMDAGTIRKVR